MLHHTHLKAWRKFRHLTQERLAERLGVSTATVSRIENARQPYSQAYLEAAADALLTTPGSLLERDPTQPAAEIVDLLARMSPEGVRQAARIIRALAEESAA